MARKKNHATLIILAIILGVYGFRWVTQAGQGLDVVQNDGYGATGGVFILIAGMIVGWAWAKREPVETPRKIKKQSEANLNELLEFAKSKKGK